MILGRLSDADERFLNESGNPIFLQRVNGMSEEERKGYELYEPDDMRHYCREQIQWLEVEKEILEEESGHSVDEIEVMREYRVRGNCTRFRAYYVLSNPDRVHRED